MSALRETVGAKGFASGFSGLVGWVMNLLPVNEVIEQGLRHEVQMYPDYAVREIVANALIHQDLTMSGSGPMIELFSDRIEISNPGKPLLDPARFIDGFPRSRNERLAKTMRQAGICEERGSGWDRITFEVEVHQLPPPLIEASTDATRVVLFAHKTLSAMEKADRVRAVYQHTTASIRS